MSRHAGPSHIQEVAHRGYRTRPIVAQLLVQSERPLEPGNRTAAKTGV